MKAGSLVVAYLHPGEVSHSFHQSMERHFSYDLTHAQRLIGKIREECGAGRITDGRNSAVRQFLQTEGEWLAFVDADMGFAPDTFDRLIEAADPTERPIVGALAYAQRKGPETDTGARRFEEIPTIYQWVDAPGAAGVAPVHNFPKNALVKCDATGAACFVAHRSVFEKLAEVFPRPREWFDETVYKGQVFGEDITFFRRCAENGIPVHVHTGVQTSHRKAQYLTAETVRTEHPTYVVVPVKDRLDLTSNLLRQLQDQGGYEAIFVYDNGSGKKTKNWLSTQSIAEVFDADGESIHEMWNRGIEEAASRAWPCNIAILNNDLELGDNFLQGLSTALRGNPNLSIVGPNYDNRPGEGIQHVTDICANRYDGTGGLPGFAFMLRGESGYRFPANLTWWYGDNDMVLSCLYAGGQVGLVLDTHVTHVDGGSQTGDWTDPELQEVLERDRQAFMAKWSKQPELHTIVFWGDPQVDKVSERFQVVDVRPFTDVDMYAFYPVSAEEVDRKKRLVGSQATLVTVIDDQPAHDMRETTRGVRSVNTNLYDFKQQLRSQADNPETVHASDTPAEADANLRVLHPGFGTVEEALEALGDHVVMRVGDDIDVLVPNLEEAAENLQAVKAFPAPRVHYKVQIAGEWELFDLRYVGDGYYDEKWQLDMLDRRVIRDGMWRLSDEDDEWALAYHAWCHKGQLGKYADTVTVARPDVAEWLQSKGYDFTQPEDPTVPLFGVVDGHVVDGFGAAARDVEAGWYEHLGPLYPGTLNVKFTRPPALTPGETIVRDGRELMLWEAQVEGQGCWMMFGGDAKDTVELLAPVRLRDALNVGNGDLIRIIVK